MIRTRPRVWRGVTLSVAAVFFLVPLAAAFWFSVHSRRQAFSFRAYGAVLGSAGFLDSLQLSLEIAAITVVIVLALMVPTVLVVHLRVPRYRALVETVSLFPLVIPPVVLVVGVRSVLGFGPDQLAGTPLQPLLSSLQNGHLPWILPLEYVVLTMPFTYRTLDAALRGSNTATLVEAATNLGASWIGTVWRVVLPTMRTALLNAAFLAIALVLGEYTVAKILLFPTFTVWLQQFNNSDGQVSVAVSLLALVVTWLLLFALAGFGSRRLRGQGATA